jgi:DNA polymerase elongation subunit (family B)
MSKIYFADIESIIKETFHTPILIGYSINYVTKIFDVKDIINQENSLDIIKQFFESINKYRGSKKIYFHNMANYDGYFILEYLTKNNIKYSIINKNNSIYKISIPRYKIQILDSLLLIPYSLENACNYFNKKYFKISYTFELLNEDNYREKKNDLIQYLKNDLFCLEELYYNFLNKIKEIFNVNNINSLTLTSIVHKEFLKRFNTIYKFENLTENQDYFIRESYIGGIVDIYKPFGKRIVELDVNSMYPSVMCSNKFGIGKPIYTKNIKDIKTFCEQYIGFIKCNVKSIKNMRYPTLAIKHNDKIIQPLGEFSGIFYTKEILNCIIHKEYDFKPIEGYYFIKSDYIFKSFIQELYEIRLKAKNNKDLGLEILTKKCLVSLYGRFGIKLDDDIINLYEYQYINQINNIKYINEYDNYCLVKHSPDNLQKSLNNEILKPRID